MNKFKAHILMVDDDEGIRELVKQYLNENNYLVTTAASAEEAKEKVKIIKFDIIILDIMMPGQNGLEFTLANKNKINTPIILLTAKNEPNERIEGLETGADDYLAKPFEPKELILRIRNILNKTKNKNQKRIISFGVVKIDLNKLLITKNSKESKINNTEKKILEKMFQAKHKKIVQIIHSPSKSIRPIFNLCNLNAIQVIKNHITKEDKYSFALNELGSYLGINRIKKIEGYDISHISGDDAVASCVVFSQKGPLKNNYRLFNIPKDLSGNDVGSLEHVMQRRLKYYDDPETKPDLILIDGGKSQLKFVNNVITNSKHKNLEVISIVKGSNRVRATETIIGNKGVVELDKYSKAFLFLQEIRDESHRFALQAQRKKKRIKITKSELDSVEGIGKVLKQRLLKSFKNVRKIKLSSKEDLMTVNGINEKIATEILFRLRK